MAVKKMTNVKRKWEQRIKAMEKINPEKAKQLKGKFAGLKGKPRTL